MDIQDKIIDTLVEIKTELKTLASKDDLQTLRNDMIQMFDDQAVILRRLDQERFFTSEHIRRIEEDVAMLKRHLHLA
ncbi:MAG: hypothetical protein NUV84_05155 [Candidatus Uhrbacteria bacterium]|nr:hypothetical protein [Candidatus Uhrbacteria bacterium]